MVEFMGLFFQDLFLFQSSAILFFKPLKHCSSVCYSMRTVIVHSTGAEMQGFQWHNKNLMEKDATFYCICISTCC